MRISHKKKEGLAASLCQDISQEEGMAVINTFQGGEATFASTRGTLTRIDYITVPAEMLGRLNLCRVVVRKNWNTAAAEKEHEKARPLFGNRRLSKMSNVRKSKRRGGVLDERMEKPGSERRCRRGARRK